jgi:hypothetical protein
VWRIKRLRLPEIEHPLGSSSQSVAQAVSAIRATFCSWRVRPSKSYLIPNPQAGGTGTIPFTLDPGKHWMGIARRRQDIIPDIDNGKYYIGVYATNRDRPYLVRIPKPRSKLPKNAQPMPQ